MSISLHGPTAVSGTFNVLGTENGQFILQGNLTVEQVIELRDECNKLLKTLKR